MPAGTCATLATPHAPGAIAVIQLHAAPPSDVFEPIALLTGRDDWAPGRCRLAAILDRDAIGAIDDAVVVLLDRSRATIMPHGGPRIVQRILERLAQLGVTIVASDAIDPCAAFPEAVDRFEALMLATLARAESPLAIDLLLDQPRRWRAALASARSRGAPWIVSDDDRARSLRLSRLIVPPSVVLVGAPNIGKSTLVNTLAGRPVALASDRPGTTRDHVGVALELEGLAVHWHDTPGLRETDDAIEREAHRLALRTMESADLLVVAADATTGWPATPRAPDLRVGLRSDLGGREDVDVRVSARTGEGIRALVRAVRDALVPPADLADRGPWLFDDRLLAASATR
ncbi:MAG: GTPase [Phycisphaerales bacterium]